MNIIGWFYVVVVFFLIAAFFIGDALQKLAKVRLANRDQHVFTSIFWGIVLVVIVYSVIKTGGITINLFFIPLVLAFIYIGRTQKTFALIPDTTDKIKWKDVLIYGIVFTIYFGINALRITNPGEDFIFMVPQQDIIFYFENADSLNRYGIENYYNSLNYFSDYKGTTPYHYFELWIIAFLSFIAQELTIYGFQICLLPIFQLLLFIPIRGYLKSDKILVNTVCAFLLTFISGYVPDALRGLGHLQYAEALQMHGTIYVYVGVYFLFIMASLAYKKSFLISFLILISLSVASFTTFPALIGGIAAFAVLNLFKARGKIEQYLKENDYMKYSRREYLAVLAFTLFFGLGILIFYKITGNKIEDGNLSVTKNHFLSADYILALKNIIGRPNILIVIPFLYLFITVYIFYQKRIIKEVLSNNIFLVFIFCYASSFAAFLILYEIPDSFQLFRNFTTISLYVFFIYVLIKVINSYFHKAERKHLFLLPFFFLLIFNVYENCTTKQFSFKHDSSYIGKIVKELDSNKGPLNCAFLSNSDTTKEVSLTFYHRNINKHGYVRYSEKCLGIYQANDSYRYIDNKFTLEISRKTSAFLRFRAKNKNKELGLVQYEFMKNSNVQYLIIQAGELISPFLKTKIEFLFRDPVSGDAFYKVL